MEQITASDLQQMFVDVADAGTYGCFEYQGISVGLHSDEPDMLDWFGRFFGGYFTVTAKERTDAVVYSSRDPAVFPPLKELAHPGHRAQDETEYVVDAQHRIIYSREVDEAKGRSRRTASSSPSRAGTCWSRLPARSRIARRPSSGLSAT